MVVNHCKLLLPQTLPATMTRKINEKKKNQKTKTKPPVLVQSVATKGHQLGGLYPPEFHSDGSGC